MSQDNTDNLLAEAWGYFEKPSHMITLLLKTNKATKAQFASMTIQFAELVLPIWELRRPSELHPRTVVEAARKWLDNQTKENKAAVLAAFTSNGATVISATYAQFATCAAAAVDAQDKESAANAAVFAADHALACLPTTSEYLAVIIRRVMGRNPFKNK